MAKQRSRESQDVHQAKLIKKSRGNVLVGEGEIKKRWRDYFEQLMNTENDRVRRLVNPAEETEVPQVNEEEVLAAAKRMKRGKAVGTDNIPIEAWQAMGRKGIEILTKLSRKIMDIERMPDEWRLSLLIPIFKNIEDIHDCGNYRGIKPTSHKLKLWERVIDRRLRGIVTISDQQFGFMPGRSTTDQMLSLHCDT